jgi:hypothetical protein
MARTLVAANPALRPQLHKAKVSAPFHSIESVDNLISVEDGYQPVQCECGVPWAWHVVFCEDAPGILDSLQYSVLIRGFIVRA